jgi:hypothetical protein
LPLLHQGPLLVDDLMSIGADEFLDVGAFWLRKSMGQPGDLGQGVGFLLDRLAGRPVFFPHGDDHKGQ